MCVGGGGVVCRLGSGTAWRELLGLACSKWGNTLSREFASGIFNKRKSCVLPGMYLEGEFHAG